MLIYSAPIVALLSKSWTRLPQMNFSDGLFASVLPDTVYFLYIQKERCKLREYLPTL